LSRVRSIGIIAGTGYFGMGLAARFAVSYEVLIGSRERARANFVAEEVRRLTGLKVRGATNSEAADSSDVAILALPNRAAEQLIRDLSEPLEGKLVISPIVPMREKKGLFLYSPDRVSAAERVSSILRKSRVAAAFHTLPAQMLLAVRRVLDYSVPVTCENKSIFSEVAFIVSSIRNLHPVYAGPLSTSSSIEALTPMLLNIARFNGMKNPSIRIVPQQRGPLS